MQIKTQKLLYKTVIFDYCGDAWSAFHNVMGNKQMRDLFPLKAILWTVMLRLFGGFYGGQQQIFSTLGETGHFLILCCCMVQSIIQPVTS